MAHQVISEEELQLLLSSNYHKEEPSEKPKLTLKFLHELIRKLQHENLLLAKRVVELEQQLESFQRIQVEAAASLEVPVLAEPEAERTETNLDTDLPGTFLIPRSERHSSEKKKQKPFWSLWFRPSN
ncbi:hypothetical protein [Paenibacillus sedimenti]|uniref:Uncharacterized protein n=1 Tax=Paenibacillus sedimenti TaxID=2770274 RepID=A0A926QI04_9BACL|nr:hypothetical protein [Paenibacillus sedimenti]MBD0378822.1 hypothetical protein [Paenibacillus sedimenti]